jgi:hypothetical protein
MVWFYGAPTQFRSYGARTGTMTLANVRCYSLGSKQPHLLELLWDADTPVIQTHFVSSDYHAGINRCCNSDASTITKATLKPQGETFQEYLKNHLSDDLVLASILRLSTRPQNSFLKYKNLTAQAGLEHTEVRGQVTQNPWAFKHFTMDNL